MVPDIRVLSLLTVRQVLDAREGRPGPISILNRPFMSLHKRLAKLLEYLSFESLRLQCVFPRKPR
jgi:hypothetical protein